MLRTFAKKNIPEKLLRVLYRYIVNPYLISKSYIYDCKRYLNYSDSFALSRKEEILGNIIKHYHVIEKGLTMPETKFGFGKEKVLQLINECLIFREKFGSEDSQFNHAISVLKEYNHFHCENNYILSSDLSAKLLELTNSVPSAKISQQIKVSKEDYFRYTHSSFDLFAKSRASVRNFTNKRISMNIILSALELAKSTPSACNRQSWRTYVFDDHSKIQKILEIQGGNRGFGHLVDKLIVVTGNIEVFGHAFERNQVYIDGGMYLMNLIFSLHFHQIATCPLNCSNTPQKDSLLMSLCKIPKSEVFIAMIACGIPPEEFKLANSPRNSIEFTNKIIQ